MTQRAVLSKEEKAGRGMSGGKIESLATAFRTAAGSAFGITIIEKASVTAGVIAAPTNVGLVVNCTMYEDTEAHDYPFFFNYPSEALLYEISANAIDLDTYDVYWSSLAYATPRIEEAD